ncbi:MAG TPA: hypothetical protein DCL44_01045 [Elusimicrobia bacterium]|nr:hypothetical protein [Elusimicrobiota bacterium]
MEEKHKEIQMRRLGIQMGMLVFISGSCALTYEVLWMRMLGLVFGNSAYSIGTLLAIFMTGLALGSYLLGAYSDHCAKPLRLFAYIEIGIGLYCSITPFLFPVIIWLQNSLPITFASTGLSLTIFRVLLSSLLLLPPTVLMGGTMPVLIRGFTEHMQKAGSTIGKLYFLNTLGAATGALLTGFCLINWLGVSGSIYLAAGINITIGLTALLLFNSGSSGDTPRNSFITRLSGGSPELKPFAPILIIAGLSGFTALAYETLWTRLLIQIIGSSIYAFALILTAFLLGIAFGSLMVNPLVDKKEQKFALLAMINIGIGSFSMLAFAALSIIPLIFIRLYALCHGIFPLFEFSKFILILALLIIPSILMGISFPLIASFALKYKNSGKRLGMIFGINALGACLGALGVTFAVIPLLGIYRGMQVVCFISLAMGVFLILQEPTLKQRPVLTRVFLSALAGTILLISFIPFPSRQILGSGVFVYANTFLTQKGGMRTWREQMNKVKLLFHKDGISAAVDVWENAGVLSLRINGKTDASTDSGGDLSTQLLLAHIPINLGQATNWAIEPSSSNALIIGLGSGVTLGAAALYPFKTIDCLEIEPAVVEASKWFKVFNRDVLSKSSAVKLVLDDARHFLALTPDKKYNIIISEPSNPWISGVSNLFTIEFYKLAEKKLSSNGLFCQWFHLYDLQTEDIQVQLKTFMTVFPHVSIWQVSQTSRDIMLIGSKEELIIDARKLETALSRKEVSGDLQFLNIADLVSFLTHFIMAQERVRELSADAPLNTDDRPWLELHAPKSITIPQLAQANRNLIFKYSETVSLVLRNFSRNHDLANTYINQGSLNQALQERLSMKQNLKEPAIYLDMIFMDLLNNRPQSALDHLAGFEKRMTDKEKINKQNKAKINKLRQSLTAEFQQASCYWSLGLLYHEVSEGYIAATLFDIALRINPDYINQAFSVL